MKILYLIPSFLHGYGGHLYNLKEIIKNLDRKTIEPIIAVVGTGKITHILDSIECQKFYLYAKKADEVKIIIDKLEAIVKEEKPNILHSYGNSSLPFVMYLSRIYKIPFIHTQPGGVNPSFFPRIPYLVVFSRENEEYFLNHPKARGMEVFYLPNRVSKIIPDTIRIQKLKKKLNFPPGPIFLRIARICGTYKESFLKSIGLIQKLNDDGLKTNLLILGVKEDESVYEEIKKHESKFIKVIIDKEYIFDADDLIDIADGVIGVGNSFMTAASLGKILLTTPSFTHYPILVNKENFQHFFRYNFSCRCPLPLNQLSIDENESYKSLKELLADKNKQEKYKAFAFGLFKEYFDVERLKGKYEKIYSRLVYKNLASPKDYYLRLKYTLFAFNNVEKKISRNRLKYISLKIVLKMFFKIFSEKIKKIKLLT